MKEINIIILDGMENIDFKRVTQMLTKAVWSKNIGIEEVERGAAHSALVVGAFYHGNTVGYARVISDKTRFAYIADVYVDEVYRNMGIAKKMMQYILSHDSLKEVYQWLLKSNADELYKKLGFKNFEDPQRWMAIVNERGSKL